MIRSYEGHDFTQKSGHDKMTPNEPELLYVWRIS